MADSLTTLPLSSGARLRQNHAIAISWVHPPSALALLKLAAEECTIGRGTDCDYRLEVHQVSREHARVSRKGPLWRINDLNSTNGTFVDGEKTGECALCPGQVIRLGGAIGVVIHLEEASDDTSFRAWAPGLWGGTRIGRAFQELAKIAPSDLPVLLEGETGVGKEVFARATHEQSGRAGPLVAVNCAALPESLAEGELFGYRRGAFTGAERPNPGFLKAASGGTLFLDEVVELPLGIQAKLLRAIEEGQVVPLGESTPLPLDLRVVAAAQKPLLGCVDAGTFRRDLYARLNGYRLRIPPLRERREDILLLFQRLLNQHCGGRAPSLNAKAAEALCLYSWPMNVRELVLLARRLAVAHGLENELSLQHLPEEITRRPEAPAVAAGRSSVPDQDDVDIQRLQSALREHRGNVLRASALIGMSRQRAYRLLAMYEVDLDPYRQGSAT